ncbi:MAG: hypothetical protein IT285_15245 [Bdellovibrionales bacterium]|nr:hypothetical protein [Bdellovibrionales bacterium]
MRTQPVRRRRLLVYPGFQLALFFVNTVIMTCAFTAVGLLTTFSVSRMRARGTLEAFAPADEFVRFLDFQEQLVYLHLGAALVLAFAFSWVVTLMVSHKMAGPLVRLKRHLEALADHGEAPPLDFREDDYFTEIPPLMNRAVARLKAKGLKSAGKPGGARRSGGSSSRAA